MGHHTAAVLNRDLAFVVFTEDPVLIQLLDFAVNFPNTTFFEVLLPHGAHKYALLEDIEIHRDGLARCPQMPGIGAEIDFDLIKRKQTAHLT